MPNSPYIAPDIHNLVAENLRASGLNMYMPGAAAGAYSFGANPTMGVSNYLSLRNAYGRQSELRYAAAYDNTSLQIGTFFANAQYGNNRNNADYANAVQRNTQMAALMVNHPSVAPYFAGSAMDMYTGIQTMVGASGARINGNTVFGGGVANDFIARQLYKNVQNNFFNGALGMGNTKTFGFDKTEFGQLFTALGSRGSFDNVIDATMTQNSNGSYDVNFKDGVVQKLNQKMEQAAKSFGLLKDLFGATKSIGQLVNIAENIGGADFADPSSFRNLQSRIMRTVTRSMSLGMDPRAAMEMEAGLSESFRGMGYSRTSAGALAGDVGDAATRQFDAYRGMRAKAFANNVYLPHIDLPAMAGAQADLHHKMIAHPENQAALMALDLLQSGSLTGEQAATLNSAFADTSEAGRSRLVSALSGMGFKNIGGYIAQRGGSQGVYSTLQDPSRFNNYTQAVLNRRSNNDLVKSLMNGQNLTGYEGRESQMISLTQSIVGTLQKSSQVEVASALARAGTPEQKRAALDAILSADASGMSPEEKKSMLDGIMSFDKTGRNFGHILNEFQSAFARNPNVSLSEGDRRRQVLAELKANSVFENLTPSGSPMTQFLNGIMGKNVTSDDAVLAYARLFHSDQVKELGVVDGKFVGNIKELFAGTNVSEEEISRLQSSLAATTSATEKKVILNDILYKARAAGVVINATDESGFKYAYGDKATTDRIRDTNVIDRAKYFESIMAISGKEMTEEERRAAMSDISTYSGKSTLTAEEEKTFSEKYGDEAFRRAVVANALGDKAENADRLKTAFGTNKGATLAAIQSEIEARQQQLTATNSGLNEEGKNKLREEIKKLENAKGEAVGDNMVGKLMLMMNDQWIIQLFKNPAAQNAIREAVQK